MRYLLALLAVPALAQTGSMYLATGEWCDITGVSTGTPIVITTSNQCGLANGDAVVPIDVLGATIVSVRKTNSSDTAHLAYKVASLATAGAGYTFSLKEIDGTTDTVGTVNAGGTCGGAPASVVDNCTYTGGGMIGKATAYSLKSGPLLHLDGTGGTQTLSFQNSPKNNAANPSRDLVISEAQWFTTNWARRWGYDMLNSAGGESQTYGGGVINTALHYHMTGDTTSRDEMVYYVKNHYDSIYGTTACNEAVTACGVPVSGMTDYGYQYAVEPFMQAFSIAAAAGLLTGGEIQTIADYWLNDQPWSQHGNGYTGVLKTRGLFTKTIQDTSRGTVTLTHNSTAVTGSGGNNFTTLCAVGGYFVEALDAYGRTNLIASITDDTHLVLAAPLGRSATGSGQAWGCAPRWTTASYGHDWVMAHYQYSTLNGASTPGGNDPNGGVSSIYYPTDGGAYQDQGFNNHAYTRTVAKLEVGLALCPYDPRGCVIATRAAAWLQWRAKPFILKSWSAWSWAGMTYQQDRVLRPIITWQKILKNSLTGSPDVFAGTSVIDNAAKHLIYGVVPREQFLRGGDQEKLSIAGRLSGSLSAMANATSTVASNLKWWLTNVLYYEPNESPGSTRYAYDATSIGYAAKARVAENFMTYEPGVSAVEPPTYYLPVSHSAKCLSEFSSAHCDYITDVRNMAVSRTSWADSAMYVGLDLQGGGGRDHFGTGAGPFPYIYRNGRKLLEVDNLNNTNPEQRNYVYVGGDSNTYQFGQSRVFGIPIYRQSASANFLSVEVDGKPLYTDQSAITSLRRQFFRMGDYLIDHVIGAFSSSQSVRWANHYGLNIEAYSDCGTPSTTTCVTVDTGAKTVRNNQPAQTSLGYYLTLDARLNSKVIGTSGAGNIAIVPNIGYTGNSGKTLRVDICPSADGTTCTNATSIDAFEVHQACPNVTCTMPAFTTTTSGIWTTVEIPDTTTPQVLTFTKSGNSASSVTLPTTTHSGTGNYLVAGLTAGSYTITGGSGGSCTVLTGEQTCSFASTSGTISLSAGGGGGSGTGTTTRGVTGRGVVVR